MDGYFKRTRLVALGATVALIFGTGGLLTASASSPSRGSLLTSIVPCRLVDTREGVTLGSGTTRTQPVIGQHGDCNIPIDAVAVSMNITIVDPSANSFLTVWPDGESRPTASSLNWVAGQSPTPNAVTS